MLARVLIPAWTNPGVAEASHQGGNSGEITQESSNPPRLNLARRRFCVAGSALHIPRIGGRQLSAVQGLARGVRIKASEELGLRRLALMSFRRRSVWTPGFSLNRRCWNCRGTVRLIGREFRALA